MWPYVHSGKSDELITLVKFVKCKAVKAGVNKNLSEI